MNEKIKKFIEEHKTEIAVAGVTTVSIACGIVGYKLGGRKFNNFRKSIGNDEFIKKLMMAIGDSEGCYFRTLGPEHILKLKDVEKLAKEAIDNEASVPYMEDNIVGMFILTRPEG